MRRLRLQGQNERLLREAVRELVVEEPKSGARIAAEIAEFALIKPSFQMSGPLGMGAVGGVFYPNTGFLSGFSASIPFLVTARKGSSDLTSSAYLLMFENDAMARGLERVVQNNLMYPPSFRSPTNDEVRQIFKDRLPVQDRSWTSIPRAVLPSALEQPRAWESRFRIMEELPKDNPNPLLPERSQGRLNGLELVLHERRSDSPGSQKIWRIFGEVAPTSALDLIVASASVVFDSLGAAAESIPQPFIDRLMQGPGQAKLGAVILQVIKSGNIAWGIASIATAAVSLVDSVVDLRRVERAESINPYAGRTRRVVLARTKVLLNTVSLVLGVAAAACDAITATVNAKRGPDVAAKVEKAIRIGKISTTVIGMIAGTVDTYEFFRSDVLATLMPYKEEILAAIEGIKYDPSKLGVSRTNYVVEAMDMLVEELNKA